MIEQESDGTRLIVDSAVRHFVDISSNTDRLHLARAMLIAATEMTAGVQVESYDVLQRDGGLVLRRKLALASMESGQVIETLYTPDSSPQRLLDQFGRVFSDPPGLFHTTAMADSVETWTAVSLEDHSMTIVSMVTPFRLTACQMQLVSGSLLIYKNFLNLIDYSERDSLTGLLNRKTFDKYLHEVQNSLVAELHFAGDLRSKVIECGQAALAILDIDHFKKVNDTYGHLFGDEVLIMIANRMKQAFRSNDRLFRFGGEEFVIVLKNISLDQAGAVLDRFRADIEKEPFSHIGKISVSIGFTELNNAQPAAALLGHADEALYFSKDHGRNQVHCYEDLIAAGKLTSHVDSGEIELF